MFLLRFINFTAMYTNNYFYICHEKKKNMEAERKVRKKIPDLYVYVIVITFKGFYSSEIFIFTNRRLLKSCFVLKKEIDATFYAIRDSL